MCLHGVSMRRIDLCKFTSLSYFENFWEIISTQCRASIEWSIFLRSLSFMVLIFIECSIVHLKCINKSSSYQEREIKIKLYYWISNIFSSYQLLNMKALILLSIKLIICFFCNQELQSRYLLIRLKAENIISGM